MHRKQVTALRTQLRELNIEYSALVRTAADEAKNARMLELRSRRQTLMTLIAEATRLAPSRTFPFAGIFDAVERVA